MIDKSLYLYKAMSADLFVQKHCDGMWMHPSLVHRFWWAENDEDWGKRHTEHGSM